MTVRVKVKLTEPIWRTVGVRDVEIELADEAPTVGEVLDELGRLYPKFGDEIYSGAGEGDYHYSLFLNDQIVGLSRRGDALVKDGDEVFILLPVAGGEGRY